MMTAREKFHQSGFKSAFEKLAESPAFELACDYALLEFVEGQGGQVDPQKSWDAHSQQVGAQRVLNILKSLHLSLPKPPASPFQNLTMPASKVKP